MTPRDNDDTREVEDINDNEAQEPDTAPTSQDTDSECQDEDDYDDVVFPPDLSQLDPSTQASVEMPEINPDFRSGFVTVAGLPNAGKSTLINSFFENEPMITSWKEQTTRFHVRCISTDENRQIIFVDTPGWHAHPGNLEKYMLNEIKKGLDGIDVLLFLIDASDKKVNRAISVYKKAVANTKGVGWKIIALSKVDKVKRDTLLPLLQKVSSECSCDEIIPLSSVKGENMEALNKAITDHLPQGPQFYPEFVTVDKPVDFVFSEFIREQIHRMTHAEVPFSTAVEVNSAEESDTEVFIDAAIYVERDSQKGILIGSKGKTVKLIKQRARKRIQKFTGKKVNMSLKVKVSEKWTKNPGRMRYLGYK